jgi:hypothetical protein
LDDIERKAYIARISVDPEKSRSQMEILFAQLEQQRRTIDEFRSALAVAEIKLEKAQTALAADRAAA